MQKLINMPNEILVVIFKKLERKELEAIYYVCIRFQEIIIYTIELHRRVCMSCVTMFLYGATMPRLYIRRRILDILLAKAPKNRDELKTFIVQAVSYSIKKVTMNFIEPLLLIKDDTKEFLWLEEHQQALEDIKDALKDEIFETYVNSTKKTKFKCLTSLEIAFNKSRILVPHDFTSPVSHLLFNDSDLKYKINVLSASKRRNVY